MSKRFQLFIHFCLSNLNRRFFSRNARWSVEQLSSQWSWDKNQKSIEVKENCVMWRRKFSTAAEYSFKSSERKNETIWMRSKNHFSKFFTRRSRAYIEFAMSRESILVVSAKFVIVTTHSATSWPLEHSMDQQVTIVSDSECWEVTSYSLHRVQATMIVSMTFLSTRPLRLQLTSVSPLLACCMQTQFSEWKNVVLDALDSLDVKLKLFPSSRTTERIESEVSQPPKVAELHENVVSVCILFCLRQTLPSPWKCIKNALPCILHFSEHENEFFNFFPLFFMEKLFRSFFHPRTLLLWVERQIEFGWQIYDLLASWQQWRRRLAMEHESLERNADEN